MRPNRLQASLAHVFGPVAPPSEGFLRTAYAALTFNGGHLILHKCALVAPLSHARKNPKTLKP